MCAMKSAYCEGANVSLHRWGKCFENQQSTVWVSYSLKVVTFEYHFSSSSYVSSTYVFTFVEYNNLCLFVHFVFMRNYNTKCYIAQCRECCIAFISLYYNPLIARIAAGQFYNVMLY